MCGITAILSKSGTRADPECIRYANQALSHRGPDHESEFYYQNISLGHTRLSIVDLANGTQPFFSLDRSCCVIANGEIYNFPQLRQELLTQGISMKTSCDCEVLVHLYKLHGPEFVAKLEGMFAFILLDTQRNQIFVARDRTGMKPLFVYEDSKSLIFSSEIKGIFATGLAERAFNPEGLQDAFIFSYIPGDITLFQGVKHVPAATWRRYSLEAQLVEESTYWWPQFSSPDSRPRLWTTYSKPLQQNLTSAVRSHLLGDVPIGAYLSGGMDSTIVTLLMQKLITQAEELTAYSIGFSDSNFDESPIFERTVRQKGLNSRCYRLEQIKLENFCDVVANIEQPQFSPIDVPLWHLSRLVNSSGGKVVLAGEGADELYGGYFSYTLNQLNLALSMPSIESLKPAFLPLVLRYYLGENSFKQDVLELYQGSGRNIIAQFGTYPAWYPYWLVRARRSTELFGTDHVQRLQNHDYFGGLAALIRSRYSKISEFDKSLFLELKTRLPNYILLRSDRNSMAHSVELRMPFLDNNVIDQSLKIPALYKMFGLKEKFILRRAFHKLLPRHVLKRRKFAFNAPNSLLWREQSPAYDYLSDENIRRVGIFDIANVNKLKKKLVSIAPDEREDALCFMTGMLSVHILYDQIIKQPLPQMQSITHSNVSNAQMD